MLYRKMNNVKSELSILGFEFMRLSVKKDGRIDQKQATEMLRHAIDNCVNYVDTAYPYHNRERAVFGQSTSGRISRECEWWKSWICIRRSYFKSSNSLAPSQ